MKIVERIIKRKNLKLKIIYSNRQGMSQTSNDSAKFEIYSAAEVNDLVKCK